MARLAMTPSAECSVCLTRRRSRPASPASCNVSPRACGAWWPLTARRCGARSIASRARRRCIWSMPGPLSSACCSVRRRSMASPTRSAVPKLLELLSLKGCIVTADALNCQRVIAAKVVEQGGDYVLALKGNQAACTTMSAASSTTPPAPPRWPIPRSMAITAASRPAPAWSRPTSLGCKSDRPGLAAIGRVLRTREVGPKINTETAYYLLSNPLSAERFGAVARAHWGIENGLHWVLDVTMNEDQARNRKDHGPQNIARLRRLALNLAKLEGSKESMKRKRMRAALDDTFLTRLLAQFGKTQMR